jgi:hypothetical protein
VHRSRRTPRDAELPERGEDLAEALHGARLGEQIDLLLARAAYSPATRCTRLRW